MPDVQINIISYGIKRADEFQPHPYNAKIHPVYQQRVIGALMADLGWIVPVVESRRSGYLIDGHERVFAEFKKDPPGLVPYVIVDLTEAQEALALAALDASASLAIYDRASVDELRQKIKGADASIMDLLRRVSEDAMRVAPLTEQPPPAPPVRAGEIWRVGANRVYVRFLTELPEMLANGKPLDGVMFEPATAAYVFKELAKRGLTPIKESK